MRLRRVVSATTALLIAGASTAGAQDDRLYVGVLVGVSTLSADARSVTAPSEARVSLYKPENGLALNAFGGIHLTRFLSVQANYVWNRNDLMP